MSTSRTLTKSQLRDLEAELQGERERLRRLLRSQSSADGANEPDADSAFDVSNLNGGRGIGLATQTSERLEAIEAALARLADGTYGICAGCDTPIPYGRLIVMPESALCVTCGRV